VELPYAGSDEIGELTGAFRNMAAELARSRSELATAERERAWREMAKQVAHEIRNPLTPIKLSVQHLRQAFRDGAADREQLLQRVTETVLDQIDVLSRIATEFSHFARMPDARYERAHLGRLLDEAVAIFAEVDGIRFERSTGELPVTLLADREQLRRVFINMFRNSIQAMPGGGTILLETSVEERTVVLRVKDNGPGIPPEVLSRVFEPNFSTKSEGMGLGLAIAKKVIEDHGGTIRCESAVGHGTSFEIRLPLVA
jgi:nitrogen fixation/metabolism regulation signal transduction histidine kinase